MINKFDEPSYAKKMLDNGFITNKYLLEIIILGKYYKYKGYKPKKIEEGIVEFCYRYLLNFNEVKYSDFIHSAMKSIKRYDIHIINNIEVTQKEMDIIEELSSDSLKKFALTFLVLGKIQYAKNNSSYINIPVTKLMRFANVTSSKKNNRHDMIRELGKLELIRYSERESIKVEFIDYEGEAIFYVYDFNNIGNHYMMWTEKEKFIECEECGCLVKQTTHNKKYCKECGEEIELQRQRVKWHKYKNN